MAGTYRAESLASGEQEDSTASSLCCVTPNFGILQSIVNMAAAVPSCPPRQDRERASSDESLSWLRD